MACQPLVGEALSLRPIWHTHKWAGFTIFHQMPASEAQIGDYVMSDRNSKAWREAVREARKQGVAEKSIKNLWEMRKHFGEERCAELLAKVANNHKLANKYSCA